MVWAYTLITSAEPQLVATLGSRVANSFHVLQITKSTFGQWIYHGLSEDRSWKLGHDDVCQPFVAGAAHPPWLRRCEPHRLSSGSGDGGRGAGADQTGGDPTKTFLALIVVQMLPLVFLEKQILSCPDPISMLSRFGSKVLLMHACFLALRVCTWPLLEVGIGVCNLIGLLGVCAALYLGFGFRFSSLLCQTDLLALVLLAVGSAFLTEVVDFYNHQSLLESTIFTSANYIEILAFVPAVWMVHTTVKKGEDWSSITAAKESQASAFFTFLVLFYVMEDLFSAYRLGFNEPFGAVGHIVHFLLLLDFACFLLAHIYNPDKLSGSLLRWWGPTQHWVSFEVFLPQRLILRSATTITTSVRT
eukprot:s1566_g3.t1